MLTVTVEDVNDNPPHFLFPSATNHSLTVRSDVALDDVIAQVRAHDDDSGSNAQLHYEMTREIGVTSTDVEALFAIDGDSGDVSVIGDLSELVGSELNVTFQAEDAGQPRLRQTATLTVVVVGIGAGSGDVSGGGSDALEGVRLQNIGIVIGVACGSIVVIALLAIAIIVIACRGRRPDDDADDVKNAAGVGYQGQYNCRTTEAQRMLGSRSEIHSTSGSLTVYLRVNRPVAEPGMFPNVQV